MIERSRLELIERKWGRNSSWAVWDLPHDGESPKARVGDLSVLDVGHRPNLLSVLNPEIVLVGLNAASRDYASSRPWVNFHDPRSVANDFKIRYALQGTPLWGGYMTDLFVDLHETSSGRVQTWARSHPDVVEEQVSRFSEELVDLGSEDPLLVAFGGQVYDLLRRYVRAHRRIVKVPHYANWGSKERYRDQVRSAVQAGDPGSWRATV